MLGLHPEIQEKAFEEVQSTCHNYVSFEEMNSFTYLEAVIMVMHQQSKKNSILYSH